MNPACEENINSGLAWKEDRSVVHCLNILSKNFIKRLYKGCPERWRQCKQTLKNFFRTLSLSFVTRLPNVILPPNSLKVSWTGHNRLYKQQMVGYFFPFFTHLLLVSPLPSLFCFNMISSTLQSLSLFTWLRWLGEMSDHPCVTKCKTQCLHRSNKSSYIWNHEHFLKWKCTFSLEIYEPVTCLTNREQ